MMHRHSRSRGVASTREMEVRQPVEDGRSSQSSHHHASHQQPATGGGGWPSAPMNTVGTPHQQHHRISSSAIQHQQQHGGMTTPPPPPAHMPVTPHSCPPSSYTPHHDTTPHHGRHQGGQHSSAHSTTAHSTTSAYTNFPKTRCYRLNLERPFDISLQKSPLGRDYSGPPVHECDLPPAQGPVEYIPPVHLCSKEELARRRCHSWGGGLSTTTGVTTTGHGGEATTVASSYTGGPNSTIPSELLDNLHVSMSEESSSPSDPTSIAVSTARIFRGIVVDRHGVITSMNPRAMRSARGKDGKGGAAGGSGGGGTATVKMGEKSRQAAKIDKAKDLIDDFVENGPGGAGGAGGGSVGNAMSDEENDPSKIVCLFVMGEYEDLNDLVRDGSKKLRESKTLLDEEILRYNRPRQFLNLHGSGHGAVSGNNMIPFSPSSTHFNHANTLSPYGGDATMSGTSSNGTGGTGSDGRVRKRVFSAEKGRAIYHKVLGSTPKIKSNPRDTRASSSSNGGNGGSSNNGRGGGRNSSSNNNAAGGNGYHPHNYGCLGGSPLTASDANNPNKSQQQQQLSSNQQGQQQQSTYSPNYFPTQCNFFPNNNDWTEVLGFSVNSLWNCGANGDLTPTMSPHSNPSSPTHNGAGSPTNQFSSQQQQSQSQHGGGHGQGAGGGYSSGPPQLQYPQGPPTGYHNHQGYNSTVANGGAGGYAGSAAYNNATPSHSRQNNDEGRNPSYGYGRGGSGAGVRDTAVM